MPKNRNSGFILSRFSAINALKIYLINISMITRKYYIFGGYVLVATIITNRLCRQMTILVLVLTVKLSCFGQKQDERRILSSISMQVDTSVTNAGADLQSASATSQRRRAV